MGRSFLSTPYEVTRPVTPVVPPKFTEAPFDIDSDSDSDDVVYEAFCTPEELKVYQERAASEAATPPFSPSSPSYDPRDSATPFPVEPVNDARLRPNLRQLVAQLRPSVNTPQVLSALPDMDIPRNLSALENSDEIRARAIHIRRVLRPYINAVLNVAQLTPPSMENFMSLLERAVLLDTFGERGLPYLNAMSQLGDNEGVESPEEDGTPFDTQPLPPRPLQAENQHNAPNPALLYQTWLRAMEQRLAPAAAGIPVTATLDTSYALVPPTPDNEILPGDRVPREVDGVPQPVIEGAIPDDLINEPLLAAELANSLSSGDMYTVLRDMLPSRTSTHSYVDPLYTQYTTLLR